MIVGAAGKQPMQDGRNALGVVAGAVVGGQDGAQNEGGDEAVAAVPGLATVCQWRRPDTVRARRSSSASNPVSASWCSPMAAAASSR
jgi:uncharacterized protein YcfJ